MENTILLKLISYIKSVNVGDLIFRRDIIKFGSSIDNYRNYLTHAGYLKTEKSGMYRYIKELPKNMTYGRLVKEAYPYSEWTQKYKYIPENLDEAIEYLMRENKDNKFITRDENKFIARTHQSSGRYLRNTWGLWSGSELQTWFKERGIHHADDMSSIILTSFHRKANNQDIKLDEQIKEYRNFWEKNNPAINEGKL